MLSKLLPAGFMEQVEAFSQQLTTKLNLFEQKLTSIEKRLYDLQLDMGVLLDEKEISDAATADKQPGENKHGS